MEFIMVHSLLSSFLLYLFYCSSRSFCGVSRAELSEIVFLSELLVLFWLSGLRPLSAVVFKVPWEARRKTQGTLG